MKLFFRANLQYYDYKFIFNQSSLSSPQNCENTELDFSKIIDPEVKKFAEEYIDFFNILLTPTPDLINLTNPEDLALHQKIQNSTDLNEQAWLLFEHFNKTQEYISTETNLELVTLDIAQQQAVDNITVINPKIGTLNTPVQSTHPPVDINDPQPFAPQTIELINQISIPPEDLVNILNGGTITMDQQRILQAAGLYHKKIDGINGSGSKQAAQQALGIILLNKSHASVYELNPILQQRGLPIIIDKLTQQGRLRNTLIAKSEGYANYDTVKNSMKFTARVPSQIETNQVVNRLNKVDADGKNRLLDVFNHLKPTTPYGIILDGKTNTAYVVSGTINKPVFLRAYMVASGSGGITQPTNYRKINATNKANKSKPPAQRDKTYDNTTYGGNFTIYGAHQKRGTKSDELGKVVSLKDQRKGMSQVNNFQQSGYATMTTRAFVFEESGLAFHGTNKELSLGKNASSGCLRMSNADIIDMSEFIGGGSRVYIAPPNGTITVNPHNFSQKLIV